MDTEMSTTNRKKKPVRSFVLREGRLTKGQERALRELWPLYGISLEDTPGGAIDFEAVFNGSAPTFLEIGFGDGAALVEMAKRSPNKNFLGVEVHRPGVGRILLKIHEEQLRNVRIFREDGVEVLANAIGDGSLSGINLFFPDPWHKKKHHKRRILQRDVIALIYRKLRQGGHFHFATDWEPYALEALERLESVKGWVNCAGPRGFAERPDDRPLTKFESRGKRLGHAVWDIRMEKEDGR